MPTRRHFIASISSTLLSPLLFKAAHAEPGLIQVKIGPVKQKRNVTTAAIGLSFEKTALNQNWFNRNNRGFVNLCRLLGPAVIRLGGNQVDHTSWRGEISGLTPIQPNTIDMLADFAEATDWQVIYGLNLAHNTPELASEEAAYATRKLGGRLIAFEIGNEPSDFPNIHRPKQWTYGDYLGEWTAYAKAIKQQLPEAKFSGPCVFRSVSDYSVPFARDASTYRPLLNQHYYRGNAQTSQATIEALIAHDPNLIDIVSKLNSAAIENGEPGVRFGESNSFFLGGKPNVSDSFASALWGAFFLADITLNGAIGANFHSGTSAYTPLFFKGAEVAEVRPLFYGMMLFSRFTGGHYREVELLETSASGLSIYAIQRDDKGENIMLINTSEKSAAEVRLSGLSKRTFEGLVLRAPSLVAKSDVTLGDAPILPSGEWFPSSAPRFLASDHWLQVNVSAGSGLLLRSV